MTLDDFPEVYRRMLAAHAALGLLGFSPDDLFALFATTTALAAPESERVAVPDTLFGGAATNVGRAAANSALEVHGTVRVRQGEAELVVDCGVLPDPRRAGAWWHATVLQWNRMTQDERDQEYRRHYTAITLTLMDAALRAKGLVPPHGVTDPIGDRVPQPAEGN